MILKILYKIIVVIALLFLAFSVFRHTIYLLLPTEEIMRVTSPDNVVDAVVVQQNPSAFDPFTYLIFIVPSGEKPKIGHEKFRANRVRGLKLHWKRAGLLEINYEAARIYDFSNFRFLMDGDNGIYWVELRLLPTAPSAIDPRSHGLMIEQPD